MSFGQATQNFFPEEPESPQGVGPNDYRFVEQGSARAAPLGGPRADLRFWEAPWMLLIAAAAYVLAAVHLTYFLASRWISDPEGGREFDMTMGLGILGMITAVVLSMVLLRGYAWGRWALTAWSLLALIALLHPTLWPVGIAGIIGAILIWIPSSNGWLR